MKISDLYFGALFSIAFLASFGLIELLKRKFKLSAEITRRAAHITAGLLAVVDFIYLTKPAFALLTASGALTFWVLTKLGLMTSVHEVKRKTIGAQLLTPGFLAAFAITLPKPEHFIPAVLILSLADPIGGLVGQALKSEKKTLLGSGVFASIAFAILLALTPLSWWIAAIIAIAVAVVERFTPLGFDNLTIPIAAAGLLALF